MNWRDHLIQSPEGIDQILRLSRSIAVLGIKPEADALQPAFYVPDYMKQSGYKIIPVPVYYPEAIEILGEPVYRSLAAIPGPVDIVNVFRRAQDIPGHIGDILAKKPRAVWFQSGIRNDEAARELAMAGIDVVQDRCIMVEHRSNPGREPELYDLQAAG